MSAMAKAWPAYNKWAYAKGGTEYLQSLIGENFVDVFVNNNPNMETHDDNTYSGFSFD